VNFRHPAKLADARNRAPEACWRRRHAEEFREVEPRAAHAALVQAAQLGVGGRVVDDRGADVALFFREQIEQQAMVGPVGRRLHDQAARDAERAVHAAHVADVCRRCVVRTARPRRIFLRVAKDVHLAVPTARGRAPRGGARVALKLREFGGVQGVPVLRFSDLRLAVR
jgi:hypothetical protein